MKKIGIIGAMELEVSALKKEMTTDRVVTKAGMDFYEGTLNGCKVVVVMCGIGKVSAGMCVQILVDLFDVTHVINTGVAGSLNAKLDIGDIVVSNEAIQHDFDVTGLNYKKGQIPGIDVLAFPADKDMTQKAFEACEKVNPDIHCIKGRVVSGDQFISSKEVKERLIKEFAGDCAEMEGAAIAQAAYLNKTPYVVIRAISDKADDSAEMDYPSFEKKAAAHCAKLVIEFVGNF
ncbi:MAG: 5'-methylthioadenosine/adenosylhomocysteine nucleosidase [Lachnospiraceae bacterium]|nr:5'-methylthioadenosine/adenosylhomocysteine nucleosidase [Lachnospiraceae bacterium]